MPLDPKLQKWTTASPTILSVSFTDALIGAVYKTFYGLQVVKDTASLDYILFPEILTSNAIAAQATTTSATFVKVIDLDFDITFNVATVIEGDAIIGFTHGVNSSTGSTPSSSYIIASILKDGVEIDNGQSETITGANFKDKIGALQLTAPEPSPSPSIPNLGLYVLFRCLILIIISVNHISLLFSTTSW